ncbi:uncharacterized protein Z519_05469 [Cladophialophora bantiana CBS 173.52]|uniref:Unplaced genomic scaffold supercont1.7, whole genome shotgun sequence n=1 Tax=Cladophialophora bantiana (strain ATCC 10958 / CBS 173.52 / CDC B-1940 / NIH 8579) TaxID=1442370 RepID=A0A0D2HLI1_CLAB1|nr:uncharacterized protein Z519_05469 [Cladophialophora bantiana CBS 173.52]KIW94153.1 hypothetical protein Z519_05469 [Cladophialophora bantiana CBS 173.52]
MTANRIVKVGIIGCGEITQVSHISTLGFLSDFFTITYLCDVSAESLRHNAQKVINHIPKTTQNPAELCAAPEVDLVFIASSDEYHAIHVIEGLKHDKHVFIEKPMALCMRDADAIIEAEEKSKGKVMVGYMRRYAAAYMDMITEIGGMNKILYARVRADIIGPNSHFVAQSGTYPKVFTDFTSEVLQDRNDKASDVVHQALSVECGLPVTPESTRMWRLLCGLGSHDLSAMREALGMPEHVIGASINLPFWSAMFEYPTFSVTYESGIDNIPRFDAHIEVYSMTKSVRVQYDTPYIKGLPVTMVVCENVNGVYRESIVKRTYEDPYTLEMKELYKMVAHGTEVKTTAKDAKMDLEIFQMIIKAGTRT